jgi:quercetin dioxygenase-like cupin family protein
MAEVGTAVPTVFVDNDRVRVTEWRFAPGAATGWHRHEYDYIVTPLTSGRLKLVGHGGAVTYGELNVGKPYYRQAGVEHDVINDNPYEFAFIEVEVKAPGGA